MPSHSHENRRVSIALGIIAGFMLLCSFAASMHPDPIVRLIGRIVALAIIIAIMLTYGGDQK